MGESERVWANNGANLFAPIRPYSVAPTSAYLVVSGAPTSAYLVVSGAPTSAYVVVSLSACAPACAPTSAYVVVSGAPPPCVVRSQLRAGSPTTYGRVRANNAANLFDPIRP